MIKRKPDSRPVPPPLAVGQVWHMKELKLQVSRMGKLLVHYKLAKYDAVRIRESMSSRSDVEKFLKKNKAVLMPETASTAAP